MSQAVDFGFGEEEVMLRDAARRFFADNMPVERLHSLVAADPDPHRDLQAQWEPELWKKMAELGWTMLAVPEASGGLGMPAVAVAALCEEVGRAALPLPMISTFNVSYLLAACDSSEAGQALEAIISGAAAAAALSDGRGTWGGEVTDVTAANGSLTGVASYVQDAQKADYFLVKAGSEDGTGLYWVDASTDGVKVLPDAIIDLTRDQARVQFDGAEAIKVCADAAGAIAAAMPAIWTMTAADMVGAAEWQLQTTVEYARVRKQFDREIGFFQAIKHPLVNIMVDIDQSRSLVYNAACALDSEPEHSARYAHMAKSSAADTAAFASSRSVQFHGGIGFTWECFIHLYFKRQSHNQALWGDAAWHRAQLADILMGPVGR
jgi:alkylation response protein AidB-like acyl-CoA dehydrogenase